MRSQSHRRGVPAWLGLGLVWAVPSAAAVLTLSQARAVVTVDGKSISKEVQLPYHWDRANPGQQGGAVFDIDFDLPQAHGGVWGIYLPRLGNAYELWLNGVKLQAHGEMVQQQGDTSVYNGADFGRVPRYITVDGGHMQSSNHLRIHIRADVGRRGGLAPVVIGPQTEVFPLYERDYRWRVTGSVAVVAFCFVVGLTALALWTTDAGVPDSTRSGRDPLFFFVAVAQLFWAVYVGDVLVEAPLLPWPWWGVVQVIALDVWGGSMALACMELTDWQSNTWVVRLRQGILWLMVMAPAASLWALSQGQPLVLTSWYVAYGGTLLVFILGFLWRAFGHANAEQRILAAAALVNIVVALRDIYVFRFDASYGANTWLRYSSVLFGLALGHVALMRFRATSAQLRGLLGTLATRVSEKEIALGETYARLEVLARQQERTAERGRILRNMHDGVGSHISSAMRQLQGSGSSDPATRDEVLLTLRDALDQLKLSIDSIHLVPGDVTALLANLRYRLGPRFMAMDIELHWDVDLLPVCKNLDAGAMNELQFMLFEAFSNVLQHARAHALRVEGHVIRLDGAERVFVRVVDDGCGFDPSIGQRKGLATMRERATAIGAQLRIRSEPGQSTVEIQLDV
ncbi:MAG TPA: histidine kinase [Rhodoferax sp.]|nr:histidine kinase [Rhodoferax sp.]